MNGSCAGGTGRLYRPDGHAALHHARGAERHRRRQSQRSYSIASRCGVFAKSDIQPLLNQGAQKDDIAPEHPHRRGEPDHRGPGAGPGDRGQGGVPGRAADLPLPAAGGLRHAFWAWRACARRTPCTMWRQARPSPTPARSSTWRKSPAASPHYSVQPQLPEQRRRCSTTRRSTRSLPLRHAEGQRPHRRPPAGGQGAPIVGIDAGSTTVKAVAVNSTGGDTLSPATCPTPATRCPWCADFLQELYKKYPDIDIRSSACHRLRRGAHQKRLRPGHAAWWRPSPTSPPPSSSTRRWTSSSTSAARTSSALKSKTAPSTTSSSTRRAPPAAARFLQTFAGALGYEMADFAKLGLFRRQHPWTWAAAARCL